MPVRPRDLRGGGEDGLGVSFELNRRVVMSTLRDGLSDDFAVSTELRRCVIEGRSMTEES